MTNREKAEMKEKSCKQFINRYYLVKIETLFINLSEA